MSGYRFPAPLETRWPPNCAKRIQHFEPGFPAKTCVQKNPDAFSVLLHAALSSSMARRAVARNIGKLQMQTYTRTEIRGPATSAPANIVLIERRGRSCFQAGITWDKNRLFLHRQRQIWCNLIQQNFGTKLGVFNNAYMVLYSWIQGHKKG